MTDQELQGKIVYLTVHADRWLRRTNPTFPILMANRVARVIKVFDWESDEGKYLLDQREKSGKWKELDPREFKYVLSIFYPELVRGEKHGIKVEELFPRVFPGEKVVLFDVLPEWMATELNNPPDKIKAFKIEKKKEGEKEKKARKRVSRRVHR
jgi:hypothetical protein